MTTENVTSRKSTAIAALVEGKTLKQAANAAGVTPKTLWTWRADRAFAEELKRRRDEAFSETLAEVRVVTGRAVKVADELLKHPAAQVRLGAVKAVLAVALRSNDQINLEQRLTALEEREREEEGE